MTEDEKRARFEKKKAYYAARYAKLSPEKRADIRARQLARDRELQAARTVQEKAERARLQRERFWSLSEDQRNEVRRKAAEKSAAKRKRDASFKVYACVLTRIGELVKKGYRSDSTKELIGDDFVEVLTARLSPGMTWGNHGTVWHMDHVVPCKWFDLTRPEHQRACFHHSNVNPEFAKTNISKSNRVSRRAFDEVMARCPEKHKAVFEEIIWKIRRKEYPERMLHRVHGHV